MASEQLFGWGKLYGRTKPGNDGRDAEKEVTEEGRRLLDRAHAPIGNCRNFMSVFMPNRVSVSVACVCGL